MTSSQSIAERNTIKINETLMRMEQALPTMTAMSTRRPSQSSSKQIKDWMKESASTKHPGEIVRSSSNKSLKAMLPPKVSVQESALEVTRMMDEEEEQSNNNNNNNVVVIKTTEEKLREAERIIATEVFNLNHIPENMTSWCALACLFQMLQAIILFFIAIGNANDNWYWFVSYPDPSSSNGGPAMKSQLKEVASFSVLWLIPLVPLLSGIQHLSCIAFRESYTYYIARHQNPFRWTEYTLSAPLMKVIIAQQVGITDVQLLVCLFMLMVVSVQCPATHEAVNAKARSENRPQHWRAFFTGWIGHLSIWAILFNYYTVYTSRGGDGAGTVWVLLVLQFILDSSFAILFTLQWKKIGFGKDYVLGEKGFLLLSFTAKTLLVWLSVVNAL